MVGRGEVLLQLATQTPVHAHRCRTVGNIPYILWVCFSHIISYLVERVEQQDECYAHYHDEFIFITGYNSRRCRLHAKDYPFQFLIVMFPVCLSIHNSIFMAQIERERERVTDDELNIKFTASS